MSEDIIRIDGVEYKCCETDDVPMSRKRIRFEDGDIVAHLRPKRKQTGWSCSQCTGEITCVITLADKPVDGACLLCFAGVWQPFYGKVVE